MFWKRQLLNVAFILIYLILIPVTVVLTVYGSWFGFLIGIFLYVWAISAHGSGRQELLPPDRKRDRRMRNPARRQLIPYNPIGRQCPGCGEHQMYPRLPHCHVCGVHY